MKSSNQVPSFLSNLPIGDDLFEGKSHEKTAQILHDTIIENSLPGNVIGLEGSWGSGKSNVIEILKKKFSGSEKKIKFFTYDAWGHQEDLTRKAFLEGVIGQLLQDKNNFKGKIDWQKQLSKLNAKVSRKNIESYPKLRFFLVPLFLAILISPVLNSIYADFFDGVDLWSGREFGWFKPFLLKYFIPALLFVWAIVELVKEYKILSNDDNSDDQVRSNWRERLGKLFYWFSGRNVESRVKEHVIEEEPSVKQFKGFLDKLTNDLNADGLVIVFDNMDRLSSNEKLLSLWSSIHTFFAENEDQNLEKITIIIPYDKIHLQSFFELNENEKSDRSNNAQSYINKTFSTVFRVPPPVLSDWKTFFEKKLKEAFGDLLSADDRRLMSTLFELKTRLIDRSPRNIITFINRLVGLHRQNDENKAFYTALFILHEEQILLNPQKAISQKSIFSAEHHLIPNFEELERSIASIVYGVDKEKATEVLLSNSIDVVLTKEDQETLDSIKNHSQFQRYFNQSIQAENIVKRAYKHIAQVLETTKGVISPGMHQANWNKFILELNNLPHSEFDSFEDWHKPILESAPKNLAESFGNMLLQRIYQRWLDSPKDDEKPNMDYYYSVHEIL